MYVSIQMLKLEQFKVDLFDKNTITSPKPILNDINSKPVISVRIIY